mmetsp:Transcript_40814/g.82247  ORF Transcript_40814/g.82247 Transcript_40814/m.82247 type:complete len:266 (+) Transcript_40814:25-822(+)
MTVNAESSANSGAIGNAVKDAKDVEAALLLLEKLRDQSQISQAAHEGLRHVLSAVCEEGKASKPDTSSFKVESDEEPRHGPTGRTLKHPSSKCQQLTSEEAAEIYAMRPEVEKRSSLRRGCMAKSKLLAPRYGVSSKTVRDIWHGRTWVSATRHLWTKAEAAQRAKTGIVSDDEDKSENDARKVTLPPLLSRGELALHALQRHALVSSALLQCPHMPMPLPLPLALSQDKNQHPNLAASLGLLSSNVRGISPPLAGLGQQMCWAA